MTQLHAAEREVIVERREAQELKADLESCKLDKRNTQRNLESTLEEKKQMSDRINQLTITGMHSLKKIFFFKLDFFLLRIKSLKHIAEKSLNDELERLTKENEYQRQGINQLQYTNKILEEQ